MIKHAFEKANLPAHLRHNPLFDFSETTHFVPRWDLIEPKHFRPALKYALDLGSRNIEAIKNNPRPANFRNTSEALETSFELADYILNVLNAIIPSSEGDAAAYDDVIQQITDFNEARNYTIYQDKVLYERFKTMRIKCRKKATRQQKSLMDMQYQTFLQYGVSLSQGDKKLLQKNGRQIEKLGARIQQKIREAKDRCVIVTDQEQILAGISPYMLQASAALAKENGYHEGTWAFSLDSEFYDAFMQTAQNRSLREKMWREEHTKCTRGRNDTTAMSMKLLKLYHRQATMLGYKSYAHIALQAEMAKNPERVEAFLKEIRNESEAKLQEHRKVITLFANTQDGITKLEPWDVAYYETQYKKDIMGGLDEESLRPYFELNTTLAGIFKHLERLADIRFEKNAAYPVSHPSIQTFDVYTKQGNKHLGVMSLDLLSRPHKPNGIAWVSGIIDQGLFLGKIRSSVHSMVGKMPNGLEGEPVLLTPYAVWTLFHEFGHSINMLLSNGRYGSQSGWNAQTDWSEFPSQLHENWFFEPDVLRTFARHYQTGEMLPEKTLQKFRNIRHFGGAAREYAFAKKGWIDLFSMRCDPNKFSDLESLEKAAIRAFGTKQEHDEFLLPSFDHSFGGGYESLYSGYQRSRRMADDAFGFFNRYGLYNRQLKAGLKKALRHGGRQYGSKMFAMITGRNWTRMSAFFNTEGLRGDPHSVQDVLAYMQDNEAGLPVYEIA